MSISLGYVDSGGHHTRTVYRLTKRHPFLRAIKGVGGEGTAVVGRPGRQNAEKVPVVPVGVDSIKSLVYARLRHGAPGPGYIHLPIAPWCDTEFCMQLTAEKAVTEFRKGFPRRVWVKTRPHNEALDNLVYAYAAMASLQPVWNRIQKRHEIALEGAKSPVPPPPKAHSRQNFAFMPQRRGLF